jgi:hypothetical protein
MRVNFTHKHVISTRLLNFFVGKKVKHTRRHVNSSNLQCPHYKFVYYDVLLKT